MKIPAVVVTLAAVIVPLVMRRVRDKQPAAEPPKEPVLPDVVDEASMESFPASDPPAY